MAAGWEVSLIELSENGKKLFKVTRRFASLSVSETRVFASKEEALRQFNEWLE